MEDIYLSIDIGGSAIKYATIDRAGNIIHGDKCPTPDNLEAMYGQLSTIIEAIPNHLKGIGICSPGRVDVQTGTIYNGGALPFLHEVSFKQFIEEKYHVPCAVSNDGKAAALSEVWLGNLKDVDNGVAIVLGTGVGGGIIVNGELILGSHFQAGELSFLLRSPGKIELSNVIAFSASAVYFIKRAATLLELDDDNDGLAVFEAIKANDNEALQTLFADYCKEIAFIILNLQATLDISKAVIGGGVSAQPVLIEEIKRQYTTIREGSAAFCAAFEPVEIEACKFRNDANLLGAIYQLFLQMDSTV